MVARSHNSKDVSRVRAAAVSADSPQLLSELQQSGSPPTGGSAPCHLALVADGKYLLSANYGSGDVAVHPVEADGSLGQRTDLVKHVGDAPHAHQVLADPTGKYVLAVDLGTDSVYTYTLSSGKLTQRFQAELKAGAPGRGIWPFIRPGRMRMWRTSSTVRSLCAGITEILGS